MKTMTVDRINSLLDGTGYHVGYKSAGRVSSLYKLGNIAGDEVLYSSYLHSDKTRTNFQCKD